MPLIVNKLKNPPKGKKHSKMKKLQIKTHYAYPTSLGESNFMPSKTTPNQAMTVAQIIARTKKGLPVTGVKVPLYNETEDGVLPDLRNLDLSEVHELKVRIQQTERDIRKQLQQQEDENQRQQTEEYYRKKFTLKTDAQQPNLGLVKDDQSRELTSNPKS